MDLKTYFPYMLAVTAESFSRKLVDVYGRSFGLSREEWRLLLLLADAGKLTSRELKLRTSLDKVQISRAADKLERKGLIIRSVPAADQRLRVYTCSDAGRALFSEIFPIVEARATAIVGKMSTKDRKSLNDGIEALAKAVATHTQGLLETEDANCKEKLPESFS